MIRHGFKLIGAYCSNCEFQTVTHRSNVYDLKEDVWKEVEETHERSNGIKADLGVATCPARRLVVHYAPVMYEE